MGGIKRRRLISQLVIGAALFSLFLLLYTRDDIVSRFLIIVISVIVAILVFRAFFSMADAQSELEDHVEERHPDKSPGKDPIQTDIHQRALADISRREPPRP